MLTMNIKSLIGQTYDNYEHIIVDDANDPCTELIIQDFKDQRIVLLKHDIPKGAAAAYNTGIRHSRAQFITFLDDDDEYMPDYLEKMRTKFQTVPDTIGFLWSGIEKVTRKYDGNEPVKRIYIWPADFKNKEAGLVAATSIGNGYGVCLRRKCVERIGFFDENLEVGSDTDFLIRLADSYDFQTIPEALVKINQHGNDQLTSKTRNNERIFVREIIMKRYNDFFSRHPLSKVTQLNSFALLCYASGQKSKGRAALGTIVQIKPLRLRTYFDYISLELTGKGISETLLGYIFKRMRSNAR